jgi:hypothetical protein
LAAASWLEGDFEGVELGDVVSSCLEPLYPDGTWYGVRLFMRLLDVINSYERIDNRRSRLFSSQLHQSASASVYTFVRIITKNV